MSIRPSLHHLSNANDIYAGPIVPSQIVEILFSVLQGSCLGLLLFKLDRNDLPKHLVN